jgi:peptide deformylase
MIITNDEAALRVRCEDVLPEEVGSLIATLESELAYANRLGKGGIGLAAPQIGIAKNIAIIRLDGASGLNVDLVNCKITHAYDPVPFMQEGCLSFPGRMEDTIRFQEVHITNNLNYPNNFIATGFFAVVCQHEIDHLNSTLFIDHLAPKPKKLEPIINKIKIGPNDQCICGSGKKYKKCCKKL